MRAHYRVAALAARFARQRGGGRFRALRVGETRDAEGGHHARDRRNADERCPPPRRDRYTLTHGATPSRNNGTRMTRTRRISWAWLPRSGWKLEKDRCTVCTRVQRIATCRRALPNRSSNPEHGHVIFDPVGSPERSGKDQENQADETQRKREVAARGTDL